MRNIGFMKFCIMVLLAAAVALWGSAFASANIVIGGYYHLGESDPGAADGVAGNTTTVDSSGLGLDLAKVGETTYSSDVAAGAAAKTGSNLSMNFAGTGYYTIGSPLTVNQDNFGIEGWFKLNDLSQQGLAINGSSWIDGFGLYVIGGRLYGLYGAVQAFNTGINLPTDSWFYAALVRDEGVTKMYYNDGVAATQVVEFTGDASTPNIPSRFNIGVAGGAQDGGGEAYQDYLNGSADQVRVFAFGAQAGYTFDASTDLLINAVPEPSAFALLALCSFGLAAYGWRKRM